MRIVLEVCIVFLLVFAVDCRRKCKVLYIIVFLLYYCTVEETMYNVVYKNSTTSITYYYVLLILIVLVSSIYIVLYALPAPLTFNTTQPHYFLKICLDDSER